MSTVAENAWILISTALICLHCEVFRHSSIVMGKFWLVAILQYTFPKTVVLYTHLFLQLILNLFIVKHLLLLSFSLHTINCVTVKI